MLPALRDRAVLLVLLVGRVPQELQGSLEIPGLADPLGQRAAWARQAHRDQRVAQGQLARQGLLETQDHRGQVAQLGAPVPRDQLESQELRVRLERLVRLEVRELRAQPGQQDRPLQVTSASRPTLRV